MMMAYEQNSELVEWGLRFFDCSPVPSSEYHNGFTYYGDREPIVRNSSYQSDHRSIENDEIIENLYQADLSEAADFHPSGNSQSAGYFQESGYARSWYYFPPSSAIYSEHENGREERVDVELGRSGSYLNREENSNEDAYSTFDEQYVPTSDEAASDYERLSSRLELCGFTENKVQGDGNCQFRALSDQLYHSPENHKTVRQQVVNQLQNHRKYYEGYVPMEYSDYLKKISENGAWGDNVTLQAAADLYGVKIIVVTSFKDTYYIDILPKVQKSKKVLYLSFRAEAHYNSIYPQHQTALTMELATTKSPTKKWWDFTSKR